MIEISCVHTPTRGYGSGGGRGGRDEREGKDPFGLESFNQIEIVWLVGSVL